LIFGIFYAIITTNEISILGKKGILLMKKLLVVAVVALLAIALVACGGETATTTKGNTETTPKAPVVTTPNGVVTTTPDTDPVIPTGTTTTKGDDPTVPTSADTSSTTPDPNRPHFEGIDILNGEDADRAINPTWDGMNAGMFENHHASLDMNWAYVLLFQECENAWYTDLVMTIPDEETGEDTWMMNADYKWVLTLNGEDMVIERFSVYHVTTYGYIRMDLGADFQLAPVKEDGTIDYEIELRILDTTKDDAPVYYAWLTDPEWNGTHNFTPPAPIEMVPDPNRDPAETMIPGATAFSGPAGYDGETYVNLFDYTDKGEIKVQSKLCYNEVAPIVWTYADPVYVTSYSLVGANDDDSSPSRVITNFAFYGSNDGQNWTKLDEHNDEPLTEATNYAERNFKLATPVEYSYFMIEFTHEGTFQLSGIQLWTKE